MTTTECMVVEEPSEKDNKLGGGMPQMPDMF